jgi:hypothetical protein
MRPLPLASSPSNKSLILVNANEIAKWLTKDEARRIAWKLKACCTKQEWPWLLTVPNTADKSLSPGMTFPFAPDRYLEAG